MTKVFYVWCLFFYSLNAIAEHSGPDRLTVQERARYRATGAEIESEGTQAEREKLLEASLSDDRKNSRLQDFQSRVKRYDANFYSWIAQSRKPNSEAPEVWKEYYENLSRIRQEQVAERDALMREAVALDFPKSKAREVAITCKVRFHSFWSGSQVEQNTFTGHFFDRDEFGDGYVQSTFKFFARTHLHSLYRQACDAAKVKTLQRHRDKNIKFDDFSRNTKAPGAITECLCTAGLTLLPDRGLTTDPDRTTHEGFFPYNPHDTLQTHDTVLLDEHSG